MTSDMMDADRIRLIGKELQVELSSTENSLYFHGTSMLPFLQEGDLVVVRPVAWRDLRLGDVVTYRHEDKFPTRRIARIWGDWLTLRCDSWKNVEYYVQADDFLGRAEARFRDGHWITAKDLEWRYATLRSMIRACVPIVRLWLESVRQRNQ